ncbi:MraY family glycosyltransferase [Tessaracoccus caeni]|uniref:MraY family glycosyltransferase n=1 Tax=Tessaracoccus caeni TaxID=3031239 RepID=UPI0023DB579A|nr:MraY family glycosyltransferase [Tessaracoccus caeni]MDF1490124.1 MraY family glycosyltransferase [Tessaracoccus caeni]
MREYLLVLLVAAAATYLLAGLCRALAVRSGVLAMPRDRDVHTEPIPYFGGVAMFGGLAVALTLAIQLPFLGRYAIVGHDAMAVVLAGLLITVVGVIDDRYDLSPLVKFAGQGLAAGVAVLQGVRIRWIPLPNSIFVLDDATSILLTLAFIALCVNAVNFVDGLDGLAAGVIAIGSGVFFAYTYYLAYEQELVRATTASLITVATCGVCIGFLLHNFHPAKMFMGDSGAMLLGLLMAMSTISFTGQIDTGALRVEKGSVLPAWLPILLPLAVMVLPFVDLVAAWVRRTRKGQFWFVADKDHIHHRLLARGHSHRGAVFLMYGWTAVVSVGLVVIAFSGSVLPVIGVVVAVIVVLIATLRPIRPHAVDESDEVLLPGASAND